MDKRSRFIAELQRDAKARGLEFREGNLARQGRPRDDLGGRQGNDAAGEGD
jgi:hypothetical protein